MREFLRNQRADILLLKGFAVFSLLFPAFYSPYTDVYQSALYSGFSWAYLLLAVYMGLRLWNIRKERKRLPLQLGIYFTALLLYNLLSFYFNSQYLHWYWEQINNTVAFLFLGVLVYSEVKLEEYGNVVRFLIHCIMISNICSIIYYFLGYTRLLICNNQFVFYELPADFYETRHYWIYCHKSEYALMLVAFAALFVAYRDKFKNRITYVLSLLVLLLGLYLTHSWTGFVGVFLIFLGGMADKVNWKELRIQKKYLAVGAAFIAGAGFVGGKIFSERNLLTLGSRTEIWPAALKVIREYPQGWGMRFGESAFWVTDTFMTTNAHNVFLNQILRFSIPVGVCFTILFLGIVIYSLWKAKSFLAAGMWAAILLLMNMDYALMSNQMGMLFLISYLVCFRVRGELKVFSNQISKQQ